MATVDLFNQGGLHIIYRLSLVLCAVCMHFFLVLGLSR